MKTEQGEIEPIGGVAAVDRAMAIVLALEAAQVPLTLTEISKATQLYKSTLLRLLESLDRVGLVVRRPDQRYTLGPLSFRLGRAYEVTNPLRECIVPVLHWLIEQGTESASFHVQRDAATRICLFRIDSAHPTLDSVREGSRLPLDRGAAGKVLLRYSAQEQTRTGGSLLTASFGERDPACAAVAAPVFLAGGFLAGALSLSGPRERFTESAVQRMGELIMVAAERCTRCLGGTWPA